VAFDCRFAGPYGRQVGSRLDDFKAICRDLVKERDDIMALDQNIMPNNFTM